MALRIILVTTINGCILQLLLREHLLSNYYVPGTVLSALHVLPTVFLLAAQFEIDTVFDPTL